LGICRKGKTRTFYYATAKGGWGPKGVFAKEESSMTSGRSIFAPDKLKIDTDKAVDLARKKLGKQKNEGEEFKIRTFVDN
jgi:hypothetical protein